LLRDDWSLGQVSLWLTKEGFCRVRLDTIIGKGHKGALVSLCERKSRLMMVDKVLAQKR